MYVCMYVSQPTLMAICELFIVKNCIRLAFSEFSDNKFALNQLLIFVISPLMSFIKLVLILIFINITSLFLFVKLH